MQHSADARAPGDFPVVGLNSDASVARLKGPSRPLQDEAARAAVLLGLRSVDAVVLDEDTLHELIRALQPDVLVKGGDYTPETVVGRDLVEGRGGRLVLIPFLPGHSTSRPGSSRDGASRWNNAGRVSGPLGMVAGF